MGLTLKFIGFAFFLTMYMNTAWAESCQTPAVKHGRPLQGHAKRVFIKQCCEQMAETKGGSAEDKRQFVLMCQKGS
jgi:hypothetical protein